MIHVTKLNGTDMVLNADLIEFVESTPDTLISLTTGRKIMVKEALDDIVERIVTYRRKSVSHPVPVGGSGSVFDPEKRQ